MFRMGWNWNWTKSNNTANKTKVANTLKVAEVKGKIPNFIFTKTTFTILKIKMEIKLAAAAPSRPHLGINR